MTGFTRWQTISLVIVASTTAAITTFLAAHLYFKSSLVGGTFEPSKKRKSIGGSQTFSKVPETSIQNTDTGSEFVPPLPEPVMLLLKASKLCFLATQYDEEPHLSLMNFTYHREGDLIILCTRKNTKKFAQVSMNTKVAVLIHDFPHLNNQEATEPEKPVHGKSWSITLNGSCKILDIGSQESELLRQIHLRSNPEYAQFIEGEDIAVIKVTVEKARMCDINDRVSYWNTKQGITCSDS